MLILLAATRGTGSKDLTEQLLRRRLQELSRTQWVTGSVLALERPAHVPTTVNSTQGFPMFQRCLVVLVALAAFTPGHLLAQARQAELPLNLTAVAMSTGGVRTPAVASQVDITINRWSTSAESQRLMAVLKEKGPERLLDALQDAKSVGTIRTPGNLAYDLRFASSEPGEDGGTRIFLVTDRPVSYWEAVNRPRVSDYPFTFIELRSTRVARAKASWHWRRRSSTGAARPSSSRTTTGSRSR